MSIYITRNGETYGPYTEVEAREYIARGVFTQDDLACPEGGSEWLPISRVLPQNRPKPTAAPKSTIQSHQQSTSPTQKEQKSASPIVLFLAVLLAIVFGGGLLLFGWQYFIREHSPKPFTLPTSTTSKPAEPVFERKGVLEGEVFIVTKGGQNYKLGLVPVVLFSLDTLKPYIDQKTKEANAELSRLNPLIEAARAEMNRRAAAENSAFEAYLRADYNDPKRSALDAAHKQAEHAHETASHAYYGLVAEVRKVLSGNFYFAGLPQPLFATQTNSDGKFKIEMPAKGEFVVAANAHRSVGESEERYYWLLKISLDGASSKTVMLSNNNLSSEGASDSLILTRD